MNHIAIVILAAGKATRMGQSKQLLPWGDSTLLGSVIETILAVDATIFCVVMGAYQNEIEKKTDLSKTIVFINKNWQQGIGSSIALTTAEIDKQYPHINAILFVLADQPFISSLHINAMIQSHNNEKEAIIVTKKKDYRGVPVLFPKKFFSDLMLLSNDEGAKQIINRNKDQVREIVTQDDTADIDTFESYTALYKNFKSED